MSYSINYTEQSQNDLDGIFKYVAFTLQEPVVAVKLYEEITKSVRALEVMPLRNPIFDETPWKNLRLRKLIVKNYIVFYIVNETDETVTVVRIMYGGRNIEEQLK